MKLNNRFNKVEVNRWWWDHNFCARCGSNQGVALHHIDGCKKKFHSSLLNSYPVCLKCHKIVDSYNSGGAFGEEQRRDMTAYTMRYLVQQGYEFTDKDKEYMEDIHSRIQEILSLKE